MLFGITTAAFGLFGGLGTLVLIAALHCYYSVERESVFPIAELEKFNQK